MAGETKEPQAAAAAVQGEAATKAAAAAAPASAMTEAEVEELPKAIVRRLVKDKLAQIAAGTEGAEGGGADVIVNKDAMAAFAESARIFIHYLSATSVPLPPLFLLRFLLVVLTDLISWVNPSDEFHVHVKC